MAVLANPIAFTAYREFTKKMTFVPVIYANVYDSFFLKD
jgi:hypothetical protein